MEAARHQGEQLHAGELDIRPQDGLVLARGRALTLSVREFQLLCALVRRQGGIVARHDLYRSVWGGDLRDGDRSIDVYVHKLRVKLETALPAWHHIHTHVGFGYRFSPEPSHPFHTNATATQQDPGTTPAA
ncbi:MAG: response regulator transcription factor [Solirubrobacterales bacterium]|jgi:DNA-binding response OmpR family regulator|nr:response regulator transcription factor [Solirubrobacterales bacterium]